MNISEFNINDEFIACNHITTNELNPLVEKPYHTKASIFALCTKGVLKTIINHTQFRVEANALYNPQIQKSGETKTKGSKSGKNRGKSQFQAVIEI